MPCLFFHTARLRLCILFFFLVCAFLTISLPCNRLRYTDLSQMRTCRHVRSACSSQVPTGGSAVHQRRKYLRRVGSLSKCIPYQRTPAPTNCYDRPSKQKRTTACSWKFRLLLEDCYLLFWFSVPFLLPAATDAETPTDSREYLEQAPQPPSLSLSGLRFYSYQPE